MAACVLLRTSERVGAVKRVVVCCDGTWNRPDEEAPTNVAKLALAIADVDGEGHEQLVLYHRGVGTDRAERIRGGAFGLGLSRHVRDCYRFVVTHFEPGDELFFFGFSRGAYTARSTVGLIRNAGVLRREHDDRVDDAYSLYRDRGNARSPKGIESELFRRSFSHDGVRVRFVGVWDTVGALGIPGVPKALCGRLWAFHDTQLSSWVDFAYQALAIDERRRPFRPTLWWRDEQDANQLEQRWFVGAHSDVGGGYEECELSEITLRWMADKAADHGLALKPDHLVAQAPAGAPAHDSDPRRRGERIGPDANGMSHNSFKWPYWPLGPIRRSLVDPDNGQGHVGLAPSVDARENYDPPNLRDYRAST
jgi:uncharacterized protein (DUF2235 family)